MLTVLMTTYDGAETLPEVLEAYRRVEAPPGGWEMVVADDGSRDGSPALLQDAARDLPIRVLSLPHRGQNTTRNIALREIAGDLVVVTDDDAVPHADVLVHLRRAADANPQASIFAATVRPRWRQPPPAWVLEWVRLAPTFALNEIASGPIAPEQAVGPCFAVRAAVFEPGVRFDETRGPDGTMDYAMGSETEFLLRLGAGGHRAIGVPEAVVEHVVLPHQMTEAWILGRAERHGRGRARRETGSVGIAGRLSHQARALPHRLRVALSYVTGDRRRRFRARWHLRFLAGVARERRAVARGSA